MLYPNENQNSLPEVLAAQTEGTATEATTAVLDDSTGQETSENDAGNISNDEVMSNNKDDRRVGFSSSTSSSKDLVNEQEGVTESKKGKGKRSASEKLQRSKQQLKEKEDKITELEDAKQKAETDLQTKTQELQTKEDANQKAEKEITQLKQQLQENHTAAQLQEKITALEDANQKAEKEITQLKQQLQENHTAAQLQEKITALEDAKQKAETDLQTKTQELQTKEDANQKAEKEITQLKQQLQENHTVAQLQEKITALEDAKQKAEEKNRKLEDKSKTIEQPKQSNAARYTAGIGVGLAAGLIAFTALERTVKLEMLVMIGIAVASALVVGGITYAVLPSTQVDGVKAQEVNKKGMQLLTNGS
ncbi:coiled-coil domain-containing protein [Wolbachia endosymbiont (group A) of Anoplius nigerrimus]|uniref:hypothetical protein n=1 Tax=Wolbachia endosymbiont (group A) of Anoplius nigerrimus TaxID=2953979 RepID=UPI00222F267F|nr:hypothetical protein [Wolbachia endosymbiont (group A) of Anoplius nigerrimus]